MDVMVDFADINNMQRVLGSVGFLGSWTERVDTTKLFTLPPRWYSVAKQVLRLPVPSWNPPEATSGEIDTEEKRTMGLGKPAAPATAAKPATTTASRPPAGAPANQNKEVLEAIAKLEAHLEGKLDAIEAKVDGVTAAVAKIKIPAPAAAASAPAKTAPAKPAAAKPAAPPPAEEPADEAGDDAPAGEYTEEQLAQMNRRELSEIAPKFGINPAQQKAEDLRVAIFAAQGAGGAPAATTQAAKPAGGPRASAPKADDVSAKKAKVLMKVIEDNYDTFAGQLDPNSEEEGALRCGGDCARCPNPEGHESAALQIASCFDSVHEALGIEAPAV